MDIRTSARESIVDRRPFVVRGMNAIAYEGFDFARWLYELDELSRARFDRFLELTAEACLNGQPPCEKKV
jgi:hypothetical protein